MGAVVGGFLLPHEPGLFIKPPGAWDESEQRVHAAYDRIRMRIGELKATTVVIVGADHYVLFGPECLPAFLIGVGDVSGPYEKFPGMATGAIADNRTLAGHILRHGRDNGFDWAAAKSLRVDHSIGAPARLCALPNDSVTGIVPVYLASGVAPFISLRRAYQVGGAIRAAVEASDDDERVVIIGSGGISHWVGLPEMGQVNPQFDRKILDCVVEGDADGMLGLTDAEILGQAGNGGMEIRNFVCAMGALPGGRGEIIAYEHGPNYVAGLGFAEIHPAE